MLHIFGKTSGTWDLMADVGADGLSVDNGANLGQAGRKAGERAWLTGSVKSSEVMV
jgi:uroporphyrinogen-III decarboxylase